MLVVQLVERQIVVLVVEGSSPSEHPNRKAAGSSACCFSVGVRCTLPTPAASPLPQGATRGRIPLRRYTRLTPQPGLRFCFGVQGTLSMYPSASWLTSHSVDLKPRKHMKIVAIVPINGPQDTLGAMCRTLSYVCHFRRS